MIIEATNRIEEKDSRVAKLLNTTISDNGATVATAAATANQRGSLLEAVKAFNYYRTMWLNRKQLCMDAVDMLSEGTGKKMKDIMVGRTSFEGWRGDGDFCSMMIVNDGDCNGDSQW